MKRENEGRVDFEEVNEEVVQLVLAWKQYLWEGLHSAALRKFMLSVITGLSVTFISWVLFYLVRNGVYAQGTEQVYQPASSARLGFPWIMSGGAMSVVVGFARTNYRAFKRCYDVLVSLICLIILSPLFLMISILVKVDSEGPVFFRQARVGWNNRVFPMWKFRTMRKNAEAETGPVWAQTKDPRVTRIGLFLRKSHLDELPQLINVFIGDMSLVGPRPERPEFNEVINRKVTNFYHRLNVRPGITGLAQTQYPYGASISDAAKKLKYDLLYIRRMGLLLDLQITFWTVGRVLSGEGAR